MTDFHDITIIVPTYWGRAGGVRHADDGVFDHPTPVDGDSTLPKLLDSLAQLDTDSPPFQLLILVANVHQDIEQAARQRSNTMIEGYNYPIYVFDAADLREWQAMLPDNYAAILGMDNYARIRNNQLLVPHVMGSQVVAALDDDEIVEPDYLKIATRHDNKLGVAGIYINRDGTPFIPEKPETGNPYRDKAKIMNDALRALQGQTLPKTVVAYGGNMVFRRDLWSQVPFDPNITRGEDIDYVLNAKLAGIDFYLDMDLKIIHLPPEHYDLSPYTKFSEDVRRFVYEATKIERYASNFSVEDLMPYPAKLMQATDDEITIFLGKLYTEDMHKTPQEVLMSAQQHAAQTINEYASFRDTWRALCELIDSDKALMKQLQKTI